MSQSFGKFPSLSAFLDAYKLENKQELLRDALRSAPDIAARKIRRIQRERRDVVEVKATVLVIEPDDLDTSGGKHHRLRVRVTEVLVGDPDVADDLDEALDSGRAVFLAIRFGDAMGVREDMQGLATNAALHLRGEWITRERAQSHGGDRASVLHFTHHPLGFTCTSTKCYA